MTDASLRTAQPVIRPKRVRQTVRFPVVAGFALRLVATLIWGGHRAMARAGTAGGLAVMAGPGLLAVRR